MKYSYTYLVDKTSRGDGDPYFVLLKIPNTDLK